MKSVRRTIAGITQQQFASFVSAALLTAAVAITPSSALPANSNTASAATQSELSKLDVLPVSARSYISGALGDDLPAYHVEGNVNGFHAESRGLSSDFTAQGVEISRDDAHVRLSLDAYGHGSDLGKVTSAAATRVGENRVEYRHPGIAEWYVNGPLGLEQGFTIQQAQKTSSGRLTVALALTGNMTAKVDDDGKSATLSDNHNKRQFNYAGLIATDADGKELSSRLEVAGARLLIKVDDAHARYPVTIDPLLYQYQSTLPATFTNPYTDGGVSVAVDGKPKDFVVVVGAQYAIQPRSIHGDGKSSGVVYVFESLNCCAANTTWTRSTLYPFHGANGDAFGASVSIENNAYLSSEGKSIVVGAPKRTVNGNTAQGEAYVFVRPAGGWANRSENADLTNGSGQAGFEFGFSVSIQGNNIAVGEPQPPYGSSCTPCGAGGAYVYAKPTGGWATTSTPSATVSTPSLPTGSEYGFSISISNGPGELGLVAVGAPQPIGFGGCNGCGPGSAYIGYEPTGGWSGSVIPVAVNDPNNTINDEFGMSVATSMGYLLVVGSPNATCPSLLPPPNGCGTNYPANTGLAYEYEINYGLTTPGVLFPSNGAIGDLFGLSVATDGKGGDLVTVGAPDHNGRSRGAGYLFISPGYWDSPGYYSEYQNVANGSGGQFGWSSAAYVDMGLQNGSAAVFGAPVTNSYSGAAYLYYY
jgi:hypothetical protein